MIAASRLCILCVSMALTVAAWAGTPIQIKQKDGSTWRGQVEDTVDLRFVEQRVEVLIQGVITKATDQFVTVKGTIGGIAKEKTIFRTDIVSVKTTAAGGGHATGDASADSAKPVTGTGDASSKGSPDSRAANPDAKIKGVFLLPMEGMVGESFRHEEIQAIGKEADKYGPGQIIVLLFKSGGGSVIEAELAHNAVMELRKRHRVVAWIEEAISAAAATAIACDEIYFRTDGVLGAMTAFNAGNGQSLQGEKLKSWMELCGRFMEDGGRSKYIAWAMIDDVAVVSYDKDSATGKVTWYNDKTGAHVLSDEKTNLVFTSSLATECNFSDGTADSGADLARLLDLPEWKLVSDYGTKMQADLMKTIAKAKEEVPLLSQRYGMVQGGSAVETIGKRIAILEQLIRWWDRCPFVTGQYVPPKDNLEREIADLRKQLADIKRSQQGR